ncbi:MAG: ATP phosphoribosyltransferase [Bacilli bacterium]|nr:ATP phosphoribosyltransferase [Bacilli bacterium]
MINIALSKGRIANNFLDTLVQNRLIDEKPDIDRKLLFSYSNMNIMIARSCDLPVILDSNIANMAVIGSDVIEENCPDKYTELMDLGTGKCTFVLASLPNISLENIKVIATKYPNIAKRYLEELKMQCEVIKMNGCLELYPNIGLSNGIIDLVETGSTLKANGLVKLKSFNPISTRIITTKESSNNDEINRLIKRLKSTNN